MSEGLRGDRTKGSEGGKGEREREREKERERFSIVETHGLSLTETMHDQIGHPCTHRKCLLNISLPAQQAGWKDIIRLGKHSQAGPDHHIGKGTPILQVVYSIVLLCEALVLQS